MGDFFDDVYNRQPISDVEEFLRRYSLTAIGGYLYKNGERLSYAQHQEYYNSNRGIKEQVKEYCSFIAEDDRLLTIMYSLPYVGYNGQIYNSRTGQIIVNSEFVETMYLKFELDYSRIETLMRLIVEYKQCDKIPPMILPQIDPIDNGFRFPKQAYQILKYLLFSDIQKYIFTIMSAGDMGKSTFTNLLKHLYAHEYYSADTKYMNQFSTSYYASKRLIVFNDCSSDYIENSHILKQISGGDSVQIEAKGKQGYANKINAKMLFIGNEGITYNLLDSGMTNRFINAIWDNNIAKKNPKWVNYEWTPEELAFQIQLAKDVEEMDYTAELARTTKEVLTTRNVFYSYNYEDYASKNKKPYSKDNFRKFFELVSRHYTYNEWYDIVNSKAINSNIQVSDILNKDKSTFLRPLTFDEQLEMGSIF